MPSTILVTAYMITASTTTRRANFPIVFTARRLAGAADYHRRYGCLDLSRVLTREGETWRDAGCRRS